MHGSPANSWEMLLPRFFSETITRADVWQLLSRNLWDRYLYGALYPFGYGLSYTTFGYSDLKVSKPVIGAQENITLSCTVKNTGKKAGDEVVQLYIRDDFSSVTTYDKVLRGFERIHLQPGEEQTVSFTLTPQDLGLWDKNNQFTVEPGSFSVMVGTSSEDIRLKGSFEVL